MSSLDAKEVLNPYYPQQSSDNWRFGSPMKGKVTRTRTAGRVDSAAEVSPITGSTAGVATWACMVELPAGMEAANSVEVVDLR